VNLNINLQPKQGVFDWMLENSEASFLGFGGSRGGAKSGCARRTMVKRRIKYPGTSGQILRRVWDDVLKNHVNKMWEEFPDLHEYYRAGEHVIVLPNNSRIFFDSAENKIDVERKAYGPEFMDIFIDQAEQFSEGELKQLKTTCRWPNTPLNRCKFGLFFNPGGEGAAYLQRIFSTLDYHEKEEAKDYAFLQAYGWDNIEWCRQALLEDGFVGDCYGKKCKKCAVCVFYGWTDTKRFQYFITRSQYGQEMNKLPAHMRAGQLMGDFKKFAGQYFSNFDEAVHKWPLNDINFQDYWPRWISLDWGFKHHAVATWHCQVGTVAENGQSKPLVITYRELVRQEMSERALAEEICAANGRDKILNIWGGHDLWKEDSNGTTKEKSMSAVFRAHGLPVLKHAKIDRVDGWRHMYTALDEGEWIITDNCTQCLLAIPQGVYNEKEIKKNEDMLKTNDVGDDVRDSLRYGLYSQSRPEEVPDTINLQRQTAHLDPTNRAIHIAKLTSEMRDKKMESGLVTNRSLARYARYQHRLKKRFTA
jgi:Phage terminase large subunit